MTDCLKEQQKSIDHTLSSSTGINNKLWGENPCLINSSEANRMNVKSTANKCKQIFLPSKSKTRVVGGQLRVCLGSNIGRKVGTTDDNSGKFFINK